MNASQLASYDYFKAELLRRDIFGDNVYCHFTASFAAGTVATTVCSPADVIKSRVMNASGGSAVSYFLPSFRVPFFRFSMVAD